MELRNFGMKTVSYTVIGAFAVSLMAGLPARSGAAADLIVEDSKKTASGGSATFILSDGLGLKTVQTKNRRPEPVKVNLVGEMINHATPNSSNAAAVGSQSAFSGSNPLLQFLLIKAVLDSNNRKKKEEEAKAEKAAAERAEAAKKARAEKRAEGEAAAKAAAEKAQAAAITKAVDEKQAQMMEQFKQFVEAKDAAEAEAKAEAKAKAKAKKRGKGKNRKGKRGKRKNRK